MKLAVHDFKSQRLFVDAPLGTDGAIEMQRDQANYLLNVLRLKQGDELLVFNGVDGEWRARIDVQGRKKCMLVPIKQVRSQPEPYGLTYCFAPLKQARLDYMVQKAVEMGAGELQPVITHHTQVRNINTKRMRANSIEAAEQCGILTLPKINEAMKFDGFITGLADNDLLIFCDEDAPQQHELEAADRRKADRLSILIGPEGGFSSEEREILLNRENTVRLGLGPRILRADTAAVAALAIVQSMLGDWYRDEQS